MVISLTFELSMTLDTDHFQRIFTTKVGYLKELDNEYVDPSLAEKGITVIYRDCQRQFEIVRKRRRNFVIFRRGGG